MELIWSGLLYRLRGLAREMADVAPHQVVSHTPPAVWFQCLIQWTETHKAFWGQGSKLAYYRFGYILLTRMILDQGARD